MGSPAHFLRDLAIVLVTAGATTLLFHRLRWPVVAGYLVAGVLVGPSFTPTWGSDEHSIHLLSALGVILLLFTIGLNLSLARLRAMRWHVFGLGGLQVLSCGAAFVAAGRCGRVGRRLSSELGRACGRVGGAGAGGKRFVASSGGVFASAPAACAAPSATNAATAAAISLQKTVRRISWRMSWRMSWPPRALRVFPRFRTTADKKKPAVRSKTTTRRRTFGLLPALKGKLAEKEKEIKILEIHTEGKERKYKEEIHYLGTELLWTRAEKEKEIKTLKERIEEIKKHWSAEERRNMQYDERVESLEEEIEKAILALDQTKKIFKSKTIAQIREKLIDALPLDRQTKFICLGCGIKRE